jgi:hypothetical protein
MKKRKLKAQLTAQRQELHTLAYREHRLRQALMAIAYPGTDDGKVNGQEPRAIAATVLHERDNYAK